MRKFYSFVLMAAALLIGTNAWAQNTISLKYYGGAKADQTFATLQEAIDYVNPGDSATITLSANQTLTEGILIPHVTSVATDADKIVNRAGQRICIDLGGKTIKMTSGVNHTLFSLLKGTLRFTGKGTIKREANRNGGNVFKRCAIAVTGADANKNDATKDRSKQVWSTLYVDKDVTVIGHGDDCFGIGINEIDGASVYPGFAGYQTSFLGYTTKQSRGTGNMWDPTTSDAQYSAFGVRVFINGTVDGTVRGVNVCGNINQTPGIVEGANARKYPTYPFYDHNFPYVKIGKDADVYCEPSGITDNGNGGIYLGGWAVVDIEGAVHGQTGVMVKAGDVLVQDGSVYSDCPSASFTGNYHGTVEGSGIFVASSASYAGESSVTVAGDSYIAGNGGCAIVDICATSTKEQTNTAVTHIDITGGTIVAGETGAISLGTNTSNVTDITGGVVEGKVDIGDASDESQRFHTDVSNLLPNTDDFHTTVIKDEGGKQTIVISQGEAPATADPEDPTVLTTWAFITTNQGANKSYQWTKIENAEIPANGTVILNELLINSGNGTVGNQQLTINDGATLQVERLTMNDYARIIVKAGGKLIVKGTQGIVAPVVENITLESSESAQAYFLFHPEVSSNRHPNATVKLISKGYVKNGDYDKKVWQRFGVPAYSAKIEEGAVTRKSTNKITYNYAGWIAAYDYSIDDWVTMPDEDAFVPFQCYAASSIAEEAYQTVYTFTCPLMGNTDYTLPLNPNTDWNYYANSYMAPINIMAMLNSFKDNDANVAATVYVYRSEDNWWDGINLMNSFFGPAQKEIDPMQAFIFAKRAEGAANATISYEDYIYTPFVAQMNQAPARNNHTTVNRAIIEIEAANGAKDKVYFVESDMFSAEYDNGYDASKYMNNESFNLFATINGENASKVATDNIEGIALSMTTKEQTSFTMTISNVNGMNYAIRDNLTGTEIAMVEGATYMFSTAANANIEGRFEIVPMAKMPTAIENIEATAAVKGIYTISGQFMGYNYHILPKGVYVVDGMKIVK